MWKYNLEASTQKKLKCIAEFKGHAENVTSLFFAPKKAKFFTSVGQDNTLKVWSNQDNREDF